MIRALGLNEICAYMQMDNTIRAEVKNGDTTFTQVNTDTRTLVEGELFVALRGERFDAHDFIADAVKKNPIAIVVEKFFPEVALPQLVVSDCLKALGKIAAYNRNLFAGKLIAITGSSGKTTVKAMLASVMQEAGSTHATKGNFNNHIGVPLTLLQLNAQHQFAVIEMGASGPGEIGYLCELAKPHISMINNVMPAHIEGFGSIEGVAKAKGEIYQALTATGVAVINIDDAFAGGWITESKTRNQFRVSLSNSSADFFASDIQLMSDSICFVIHYQQESIPVTLQTQGEHNIRNALMAAACATAAGVDLSKIKSGLENFLPVSGRMSRYLGINKVHIIDDSYNANPGSVRAAIDVLAGISDGVLVLGDLAELGSDSEKLHTELGEYALSKKIKKVFTLGKLSANVTRAFGNGAEHFTDRNSLIEKLKCEANSNVTYLIKGSRSARMDLIVNALTVTEPSQNNNQKITAGECH
jgi:UDP-N-acetylmuramoyl-tripeptide--D-alanyl-D-alanine ligase